MATRESRLLFLLYLLTVIEVGNSFKITKHFEDVKKQRTAECNVCAESEDCSTSNSMCIDGQCKCDYGYRREGYTCIQESLQLGKLGGPCSFRNTCETDNSICMGDTCDCDNLFVRVNNQCLPERNHNETCQHRLQCGDFQYCSCDGRCSCITDYIFDDFVTQSCGPICALNDPCSTTSQCLYANAACINGICGCSSDTGKSLENDDCVPMTVEFSVTIEFTSVFYTPRLNDEMYRNLVLKLDDFSKTAITNIESNGIKVESFEFSSVSRNPLSGKADITFTLNVFNPEYKSVSLSRGRILSLRSSPDDLHAVSDNVQNLPSEETIDVNKRETYSLTIESPGIVAEHIKDKLISAITLQQ